MRTFLLSLLTVWMASELGAETVFVEPQIFGATPQETGAYQTAFSEALGPASGTESPRAPLSGPYLTTNFFQADHRLTVTLQYFEAPTEPPVSKTLTLALPNDHLPLVLRRAVDALVHSLDPAPQGPTPVLVDEFSPASIQGVDLPVDPSLLIPYSAAMLPNGHLLVGAYSTVLELDAQFRVVGVPTRKLNDEGNQNSAATVLVTPGGTILVRGLFGGEVFSFAPGSTEYRRRSIPVEQTDTLGALADGSLFVASPTNQTAVVYRGKDRISVNFEDSVALSAVAAGPEDTLWAVDPTSGAVKIEFLDGKLKDVLFPSFRPGTVVRKLVVFSDGGFLALTTGDLRSFDRQGRLRWVYDGKADAAGVNFALLTDVAADPSAPFFFAVEAGAKKILRFTNPDHPGTAESMTLADWHKRLRLNPDQTEVEKDLAGLYSQLGALDLAAASLDAYVSDFPADSEAQDQAVRLKEALLKQRSAAEVSEVQRKLKLWGPETARDAYSRAMKTFEVLQSLVPDDPEVGVKKADLRKLFAQAETQDPGVRPGPQVVSVDLPGLFPSLMQVYLKKPAGRVTVKNTLAVPLRNLRVDFFLPRFMDAVAQGTEVPTLDPGASLSLDLPVVLNSSVLDLEEDLSLQAQLTLRFTTPEGPQELAVTRPVTLYRKTALTWDVTAKLASFITPNEQTVDLLTHRVLQNQPRDSFLSPGFVRAVTLVSALGAIPLRYVPNPHTPISEILGNSRVVDTVRFARTTLLYESGDCSDTTALTGSLFEAAGLPTAIVTTPGHVFLAFDTGESDQNAWLFQAPGFETFLWGGKVWLPLETTVLAKGFTEAWKTASALVRTYRGTKDFEFIPVQTVRSSYPALPLPPATLPIETPHREATLALAHQSLLSLDTEVYQVALAGLERQTANLSGRELSRQNNKIAVLMGRYGKVDEAAALFQKIVAGDPTFIPAYVNWANLNLQKGDFPRASSLATQARALAPDSAAVTYLIQQIAVQGRPENRDTQGRAAGEVSLSWLLD